MGGKFWSKAEKEYFMKVVMPLSKCNTSDGTYSSSSPGLGWDALAIRMQAEMDAKGESRRRYTQQMMYEHYYQKVRKPWEELRVQQKVNKFAAAADRHDVAEAWRVYRPCSRDLQGVLVSAARGQLMICDVEDEDSEDPKDEDIEESLFIQQHERQHERSPSASISQREAAEIMETFRNTEVVHRQTPLAQPSASTPPTRQFKSPCSMPGPSAARKRHGSGQPSHQRRASSSTRGRQLSSGGAVRSPGSTKPPQGCRYVRAPTATMYDMNVKKIDVLGTCRITRNRDHDGGNGAAEKTEIVENVEKERV
ncbi:hypothetical protein ACMFMF_001028 [Clarireedia jacksonii]